MKVANIESFYNYRTVGDRFDLMTSLLSINENLLPMIIKSKGNEEIAYTVEPEKRVSPTDTDTFNIHKKMCRINSAFAKISENNERVGNDRIDQFKVNFGKFNVPDTTGDEVFGFFDYFLNTNEAAREQLPRNLPNPFPPGCRRLPGTVKRPSCVNCRSICAYTTNQLLDLVGDDLTNELQSHHHPTTIKITVNRRVIVRSNDDFKRILVDHYVLIHNQPAPSVFYDRLTRKNNQPEE